MRDVDACFHEFAAVYQFPHNWGHNWSAFSEVMRELEWMPSSCYVCVVTNAEYLLKDDDPSEFLTFCKIMSGVGAEWANAIRDGEYWDRVETPFHTVFRCVPASMAAIQKKVEATGVPFAHLSE